MARTLNEVIESVPAERLAKIAAARRDKLIVAEEHRLIAEKQKRLAVEKWLRLEKTKRAMEIDRNLIAVAAVITALPIIAALAWMLNVLAVGGR